MQSAHSVHAKHRPPDRFFPPGTICMAQSQAQHVSLRQEGVPQGQDLTPRKRCEVEVMHELIGC